MSDLCKEEGQKILLVEGKNDCHVIMHLCDELNVPDAFGIHECGNDLKVLQKANALIPASTRPEILGIMLDADNNGVSPRWNQIQNKLSDHNYEFPETPDPGGTILPENPDKPRLGIWLMPNNVDSGMLEDFLMEMVDLKAVETARESTLSAQENGVTTFRAVHLSKAVIHTYLAWQDPPGQPLGQSITSHALRPETETANAFIQWLIRLFISA